MDNSKFPEKTVAVEEKKEHEKILIYMEIYVKCEYHNSVDKIGYLLSDAGINVYPYAKK